MVEHNLDMIRNADYVIDLGPESGDGGRRWSQRELLKRSLW